MEIEFITDKGKLKVDGHLSGIRSSLIDGLKRRDFTFENQWGTYRATAHYFEGTEMAPVVLFLHGLGSVKEFYDWMVEIFTGAGYVFVAINTPGGIAEIIDPKIEPYMDAFSPCIDKLVTLQDLSGILDLGKIGAMGHSAGGLGALVAATQDPRIKTVVALSPPINVDPALPKPTQLDVPVQLQVATYEGELYDGVLKYYSEELQAPVKELVVIEGGNHIQYMDKWIVNIIEIISKIIEIPYVGDQPSDITVEEQHAISSQGFMRFFNRNLAGKLGEVSRTWLIALSIIAPIIVGLSLVYVSVKSFK